MDAEKLVLPEVVSQQFTWKSPQIANPQILGKSENFYIFWQNCKGKESPSINNFVSEQPQQNSV